MKITSTTCFKAYTTNLYLDADSSARICCKQKRSDRFVLKNESDRIFYLKELRKYMEAWKWHPSCSECQNIEEGGNISVRQHFNKSLENKKSLYLSEENYTLWYLEINFSNLCNLACRMCKSTVSTWRIPLDKYLNTKVTPHTYLWKDVLEYIYNINHLKSIRHIEIFWGEPLIEQEHFKFLTFLINNKLSKKIQLGYNSNFTTIPEFSEKEQRQYGWATNIFDLWKEFKYIDFRISLDGFKETDEYIRINSKWSEVISNIQKIKHVNPWNMWISVRSTVQIDNIIDLPKFLLYLINEDIDILFSAHNYVVGPSFYCVQNLPCEIKKYIHLSYKKFFTKYPIVYNKYGHFIKDILNFMDAKVFNPAIFQQYIEVSMKVDKFYKFPHKNKVINLCEKMNINVY